MKEYIRVHNLVKHFGKIKAVDGLSFSVDKGEIFGLLGPNGSGKSTTIRMLTGLIFADEGEISISGETLGPRDVAVRRKMGSMIDRPDFYNYLTAYKNLHLLTRISGFPVSRDSIMEKLDWVGLQDHAFRRVGEYSMGMKQRLGIAQALINDPEFLILDEPANGLDPHGMVDIRHLILRLNKEFGKTLVISSHILKEIEIIADRMVVIHNGKSIAEGRVNDLLMGEHNRVRIFTDHQEKALVMLTEWGFNPEWMDEDHSVVITIREEDIASLNKKMVENGLGVKALIPARSLEDYFLEITDYAAERNPG